MYGYKHTKIEMIQQDITKLKVDAIVNAANKTLLGGRGVDGAIHKAGGPAILEACKNLNGCPTGQARITTAGNLPSTYVIHTVGPIYHGGNHNEKNLLYDAYYHSLELAYENNLKSIAFPAISTGAYGYPKKEATCVAMRAVKDFLEKYPMERVIFVVFSKEDFKIYEEECNKVWEKIG